MSQAEEHEALVEDCVEALRKVMWYFGQDETIVRAVLAVIAEKAKEWPTEGMLDVCRDEWRKRVNAKVSTGTIGRDVDEPFRANWRTMLPASPLVKPGDDQ